MFTSLDVGGMNQMNNILVALTLVVGTISSDSGERPGATVFNHSLGFILVIVC